MKPTGGFQIGSEKRPSVHSDKPMTLFRLHAGNPISEYPGKLVLRWEYDRSKWIGISP